MKKKAQSLLDDQNQALPIPEIRNTLLGTMRTWRLAPYPYLVQVLPDGFRDPDITATLDSFASRISPVIRVPRKAVWAIPLSRFMVS